MKKLNVKNNETAVFAIGGLGEIGKNAYLVARYDKEHNTRGGKK